MTWTRLRLALVTTRLGLHLVFCEVIWTWLGFVILQLGQMDLTGLEFI